MKTWRSKWSNLHAIGDKSLSLLISIYIYISEITSTYKNLLHVFLHCSKIMLFRRPDAQSPHTFLHNYFLKLKIYTARWLQTHSHKPTKNMSNFLPSQKNTRPRASSAGSLMNQRHRWWATRRHLHPYCPMPRHVKYILRLQKCGRMKWTISAFGKMAWVGDTPSSNSHHPDFYISRSGDPKKNVHFFPLILGRRQTPKIYPS